ncbi:SpoIIE family protein phosphatase [Candidatus Uhrbacteria bacterium]|nr:SpoIIE family protein phosphatase [Candidatus Uhrbacteria bacterium]
MNLEQSMRAVPPPIPESARKKGMPPIPEAAKKKSGPPPIPDAARKKSIELAHKNMEAREVQEQDVIEAFEVQGFNGLEVMATIEKKDERKGSPENHNEDNVIVDPETGLLGVLDGLGGEGQGDLASKAAERAIPEGYKKAAAEIGKLDNQEVQRRLVEQQIKKIGNPEARIQVTNMVEQMLSLDPKMAKKALALIESLRGANAAVLESGGKTTATVGFIHETPSGEKYAIVANLGDSMAFKRRKNGEMVPITQEDSALNSLTQSGALTPELLAKMKSDPKAKHPIPLSLEVIQAMGGGEQELKQFQAKGVKEIPMSYGLLKRAMVASLGSQVFEPSLGIRRLEEGDELILGTDGLVDKFEDPNTEDTNYAELSAAMSGKTSKEQMDNLRKESKKRITYKKDDDIAIVRAKVQKKN